jgi:hypothetical protein
MMSQGPENAAFPDRDASQIRSGDQHYVSGKKSIKDVAVNVQ